MNYAEIGLLSSGMQLLWAVGAVIVAVFLILAYMQQKVAGYLWLLAATVAWPMFSRLAQFGLSMMMPRIAAQQSYPMTTVAFVQILVGGVFSLIDVVLLVIAVKQLADEFRRRLTAVSTPPMAPPPQWPQV